MDSKWIQIDKDSSIKGQFHILSAETYLQKGKKKKEFFKY